MEKEKTVRMRRFGNGPGRVRYDSIDGIRNCVLYFDNVGDELELTVRPCNTKRERKAEVVLKMFTCVADSGIAPDDVDSLLKQLDLIDQETP